MNDAIGKELTELTEELKAVDLTEGAYTGARRLGMRRMVLGVTMAVMLLSGGVAGAVTLWPAGNATQLPGDGGGECETPTSDPEEPVRTPEEPTGEAEDPTEAEEDPTEVPTELPDCEEPTEEPTEEPEEPTEEPTEEPEDPTGGPTEDPEEPTEDPTDGSTVTEDPTGTGTP